MAQSESKLRVGVIGASGYTGGELLRLLAGHAQVEVTVLTAERRSGSPVAAVLPHLGGLNLPDLKRLEEADWGDVDAVYCCLPHGTTQEVIAGLPGHLKVVDLSADFRLADVAVYEKWYGHPHRAPDLQGQAVYGLSELARERIAGARLVANPGCYPTAALIPLVPLIEAGLAAAEDIIIDAKSGVSGAGRTVKEANLYAEVGEGVHAYGIATHRHAPEIDQQLSAAAGRPVVVAFTPHLVPMNRGLLSTIYVELAGASDADELRHELVRRYEGERFVRVLAPGEAPATRDVRGSNLCLVAVFADRLPGRAIIVSVIDNLVKGASGQAIQNMNLMCGLEETAGLTQPPLFP